MPINYSEFTAIGRLFDYIGMLMVGELFYGAGFCFVLLYKLSVLRIINAVI